MDIPDPDPEHDIIFVHSDLNGNCGSWTNSDDHKNKGKKSPGVVRDDEDSNPRREVLNNKGSKHRGGGGYGPPEGAKPVHPDNRGNLATALSQLGSCEILKTENREAVKKQMPPVELPDRVEIAEPPASEYLNRVEFAGGKVSSLVNSLKNRIENEWNMDGRKVKAAGARVGEYSLGKIQVESSDPFLKSTSRINQQENIDKLDFLNKQNGEERDHARKLGDVRREIAALQVDDEITKEDKFATAAVLRENTIQDRVDLRAVREQARVEKERRAKGDLDTELFNKAADTNADAALAREPRLQERARIQSEGALERKLHDRRAEQDLEHELLESREEVKDVQAEAKSARAVKSFVSEARKRQMESDERLLARERDALLDIDVKSAKVMSEALLEGDVLPVQMDNASMAANAAAARRVDEFRILSDVREAQMAEKLALERRILSARLELGMSTIVQTEDAKLQAAQSAARRKDYESAAARVRDIQDYEAREELRRMQEDERLRANVLAARNADDVHIAGARKRERERAERVRDLASVEEAKVRALANTERLRESELNSKIRELEAKQNLSRRDARLTYDQKVDSVLAEKDLLGRGAAVGIETRYQAGKMAAELLASLDPAVVAAKDAKLREETRFLRANREDLEANALANFRLKDIAENGKERVDDHLGGGVEFVRNPRYAADPELWGNYSLPHLNPRMLGNDRYMRAVDQPLVPFVVFTRRANVTFLEWMAGGLFSHKKKLVKAGKNPITPWVGDRIPTMLENSTHLRVAPTFGVSHPGLMARLGEMNLHSRADRRISRAIMSDYKFLMEWETMKKLLLGSDNFIAKGNFTSYKVNFVHPELFSVFLTECAGNRGTGNYRDQIIRKYKNTWGKYIPLPLVYDTLDAALQCVAILKLESDRTIIETGAVIPDL